MIGMEKQISLSSFVLMVLLLNFASVSSFPLEAQGMLKFSGTVEGMASEGSFASKMDLGVVGTLEVQGGCKFTAQDLLAQNPTRLTFSGGFGFVTPSAYSLIFGDLSGLPAVGLLINPHLFPYTGSILALEKQPQLVPIPFDRGDADSFTVGIASQVPMGPIATIFPFLFTPLINPENLRGGGVQSILRSSIGFITLGACLTGRSFASEPADELFYGGYPSRRGAFLQFSVQLFQQSFHVPILGEGRWASRFQLFGIQDSSLGLGVSYNSQVELGVESFSLTWDNQHLPIIVGAPGIGIPQADTSILHESQLNLVSATGKTTVSLNLTDRVWRPSPYARDHQKRTVASHTALDFNIADILIGCHLRSEVSWMVNGNIKRTGSLTLGFEHQVDDVRIVVEPAVLFTADLAPVMELDVTFGCHPRARVSWEAAIRYKPETVKIALMAGYEWDGAQVKVICDSLRKLSLSLTIGQ